MRRTTESDHLVRLNGFAWLLRGYRGSDAARLEAEATVGGGKKNISHRRFRVKIYVPCLRMSRRVHARFLVLSFSFHHLCVM